MQIMATITFGGETVELTGQLPEVGQNAPKFTVKDAEGKDVTKEDFAGKTLFISVVPDIDTSVCSIQSDKVNDWAKGVDDSVAVVTIANNEREALKAWAEANDANIPLYNDAQEFGEKYGVYMAYMDKLARSIFILDAEGKLAYKQLVAEGTDEPNYDEAFAAVDDIK